MEQENKEWISLGFVRGSQYPVGKSYGLMINAELFVKVVLGAKVYALKYKDVMYRIAPDKDGKVDIDMSEGLAHFTIPNL